MVDIPVEKKGQGTPWWLWLVLLVVIAIAAWYFLARPDDRPDPREGPANETEMPLAQAPENAITSLDQFGGDTAGLIGRPVSLMNMQVLTADETGGLFIGDETQRVFVSTSKPSGFAAGSLVNITGAVQAGNSATAGQSGPPAGLPADAPYYIEAYSIQPA
jgi:hypothetical protein